MAENIVTLLTMILFLIGVGVGFLFGYLIGWCDARNNRKED